MKRYVGVNIIIALRFMRYIIRCVFSDHLIAANFRGQFRFCVFCCCFFVVFFFVKGVIRPLCI